MNVKDKVVVLREIPREQAKQEIEQLFSADRTFYYSDIAEELRLELKLVVNICGELMQEDKIMVAENYPKCGTARAKTKEVKNARS